MNILNNIRNQFAATLIDKAKANIAFICQLFYRLAYIKELDLDHNNTGTTKAYIPVHKTNNQVISGHTVSFKNKFINKLPNIIN